MKLKEIVDGRDFLTAIIGSALVGVLCYVVRNIVGATDNILITFAEIVAILIIYGVLLVVMKNSAARLFVQLIKDKLSVKAK